MPQNCGTEKFCVLVCVASNANATIFYIYPIASSTNIASCISFKMFTIITVKIKIPSPYYSIVACKMDWICKFSVSEACITVKTIFCRISTHIIKTKSIRLFCSNFVCFRSAVAVMPCNFSNRVASGINILVMLGFASAAGGKFPFTFCWQAVAVFGLLPFECTVSAGVVFPDSISSVVNRFVAFVFTVGVEPYACLVPAYVCGRNKIFVGIVCGVAFACACYVVAVVFCPLVNFKP